MNATSRTESLLACVRTQITKKELDQFATEAGFVDPNCFDFDNMRRPLRDLSFPLGNHFEYMWAIYECGLPRLLRFSPALRQYVASIYLHCNRQCAWGMTVQGDYYHLLTQATLQNRSSVARVMAWLETLAEVNGATQDFDPRFARFCWVALDNVVRRDSASLQRKEFLRLLREPASPSFVDGLRVCETTAQRWEELYDATWSGLGEDRFEAVFFGIAGGSIAR
jgi:hypothetical protein